MKKLLAILAGFCVVLAAPLLHAEDSVPVAPASADAGDSDLKSDAAVEAHPEARVATTPSAPAPESLWNRVRNGFARCRKSTVRWSHAMRHGS